MKENILCPLDGRYAHKVSTLARYMGEDSLAFARVRTECAWLEEILSLRLPGVPAPVKAQLKILQQIPCLSEKDLAALQEYEFSGRNGRPATNHDVKAVEYFIQEKLSAAALKKYTPWIHFALTSEDINSVSYAMLLSDGLEKGLLPALENLRRSLAALARKEAKSVLLARTHGQPAVPTTFGKEVRVFESRLARQLEQLRKTRISCKFSGAVGCYNAHMAAFARIDWPRAARRLVDKLNKGRKIKLFLSPLSTQIDNRDSYAELFDNLRRVNVILLGLCQDFWRYISDGLLKQNARPGEVGSSTMPQKINPIDFENAEGNLQLCNALLSFFSQKLPLSRLQRDLSDSTVLRNMGMAFGYALAAYDSLVKGINKVSFNRQAAREQLAAHPEVLAEGLQTILRAAGIPDAYEKVKAFTRGRSFNKQDLQDFINELDVDAQTKERLRALTVFSYVGLAPRQAGGKL